LTGNNKIHSIGENSEYFVVYYINCGIGDKKMKITHTTLILFMKKIRPEHLVIQTGAEVKSLRLIPQEILSKIRKGINPSGELWVSILPLIKLNLVS
jgi:hypothetical protein